MLQTYELLVTITMLSQCWSQKHELLTTAAAAIAVTEIRIAAAAAAIVAAIAAAIVAAIAAAIVAAIAAVAVTEITTMTETARMWQLQQLQLFYG